MSNVLIGHNAGLPNVTGSFNNAQDNMYAWQSNTLDAAKNAFYAKARVNQYTYASHTYGDGVLTFGFEASRGETKTDGTLKSASDYKVFGKSDTVMVQHVSSRYWRRTS